MTSPSPESVTCLACREHARQRHLRYAEEVERLSRMAGATIDSAHASLATQKHGDIAQRFAGRLSRSGTAE